MVYVHDLSPYIFRIGDGFGLRWYGVAYVLGFVLGIAALRRAARHGKLGALQESDLEPLFWAIVIGVVVGGQGRGRRATPAEVFLAKQALARAADLPVRADLVRAVVSAQRGGQVDVCVDVRR